MQPPRIRVYIKARRLQEPSFMEPVSGFGSGSVAIFFLARHKKRISALQFRKDWRLASYQTAWRLGAKRRKPTSGGYVEAENWSYRRRSGPQKRSP